MAMKRGLLVAPVLACAAAAAAAPAKFEKNSDTLEFSYEWSPEAAAIPALDHRFRGEVLKALGTARANVREDRRLAREQKRDFHAHLYSMTWTTAGETPRLLSLQSEKGTFEGGAHQNTSFGALLWDRRTGREVSVSSLFTRPGDFEALTRPAYCRGLDAERKKRREGEKLGGEFEQCPKYSDLAIAPVDRTRNRRFDQIAFTASPYVAGPYVEGKYEILVPVTAKMVAALKPAFRYSFEAQRQ
jgi:hypothetical protein